MFLLSFRDMNISQESQKRKTKVIDKRTNTIQYFFVLLYARISAFKILYPITKEVLIEMSLAYFPTLDTNDTNNGDSSYGCLISILNEFFRLTSTVQRGLSVMEIKAYRN